jgi:chromosome segregation ATPase
MAYVEIIVDNHDHLLPVDYTEVTWKEKHSALGKVSFPSINPK